MKAFLKGFVYAFNGVLYGILSERNMRFHVSLLGFMIFFLVRYDFFKVSKTQFAVLMLAALFALPGAAADRGDVNRDGNVDALDIMAVINIIRGRDEGFNYDYDAADVNGDDDYTLMDINAIINIIRGR